MYAHFYQLAENPFNLTPDPKFHYINESTREAMASIQYGIKSRKGFITLIGEAGTGKTTLLKRVVEEIEGETTVVFVFNPGVSFDELLEFICTELGIDVGATRRLHLLEKLNSFLLEQLTDGRNVVVMIDEAQTLEDGVLEELRLLSNLETSKEKILQILLSGQPELEEKLRRPNLRQLRQRIAARATLRPMQAKEMGAYVETRMKSAGAERNDFFTPRALKKIWQVSGGIPRVINVICDNAMMIAFAEGKRQITAPVLKEAIRDLQGEADAISAGDTVRSITQNSYVRYAAAAALILAIGVPLALSGGDWMGDESTPLELGDALPPANRVPEPTRALPPLPTELTRPLAEGGVPAPEAAEAAYGEQAGDTDLVATGGMAPPPDPAISRLDADPAMRDSVLDSIRRARLLARSTAARLYDAARGDEHDEDAPNIVDAARSEMSQTTQGTSLAAAAAARREAAALAAEREAKLAEKKRSDRADRLSVAANLEPLNDLDPFGDDPQGETVAAAEAARKAEQAAMEAEAARKAEQAAMEAEAARKAEQAAREAEAARKAEQAAMEAEAAREAEQAAREAEAARKAEQAAMEAEAAREAEQAAREAEATRKAEQAAMEAEAAREAEQAAREAEAARKAEQAARVAKRAAREAEAARKSEVARKAEQQAAREAEAARKAEQAAREVELARKAEDAARQVELARKAEAAAAAKEIEAARRGEALAKQEAAAAKEEAARKGAEAAEVALAAREAATAAAEASAAAEVAVKAAAQSQVERRGVPDALAADESDIDTPDRGGLEGRVATAAEPDAGTIAGESADEAQAEVDLASLSAREARERQLASVARGAEKAAAEEPIAVVGRPVTVRALGPAGGEPLIGQLVRIEDGDTIWDIAVAHYGDAGPSTYERVLASNPGISNAKRLSVGAFIYMPFQNPDQMIRRDGESGYRVLVSAAPKPAAVEDARTWARSILKDRVEFGTATDTSDGPTVYELYAVGLPDHEAAFDVAVRVLSEYGRVRGGKGQTAQR